MKFGYADEILAVAPRLVAGVIWCKGIDNSGYVHEFDELLSEAEAVTRERFPDPPMIARDQSIAAWRAVYSQLGLTPNRYPCAAESLIRRVVTDGSIPRISPLVDLCNAASLTHAIPVAPFDLRNVVGSVIVRRARGGEVYRAIGSTELQPVEEGEVVYADDTDEVLSRRWNWRQTGKSAIQPDSNDILITTEAVHEKARTAVENVLAMLTIRLADHLDGSCQIEVLTAEDPWSERP
ncbi:MAG TPA: phenylalanine--tRNA ligase beta subunit-related protein [Thermomicrobiales bacterium]|nr:phenylalanine--tRNA ligase beta subunit-related protein [Thermomicrobiales bacterium]